MARARIGIAAVLLAAAALRLLGIGFGLPYPYANPDEHLVTDRALLMTAGEWNPRYFAYPSLCFELHALVALATFVSGWLGGRYASLAEFREACWLDPQLLLLPSRLATAGFAVATVWAAGRLGDALARQVAPDDRRIRVRARLVAAAALAFSFLHVANSRFVTVDAPSLFFATLATAHALRHLRPLRNGARHELWMAALLAGLAASCKYYAALLALPVAAAAVVRAVDRRTPRAGARRAGGALAGAGLLMAGAFLATSPFVVLDWKTFAAEFARLTAHVEGGHFGHDPARNGALVYASLLASRHVGPWLLVPAALGIAVGLARRGGRVAALVLLLQPAAHFALISSFKAQPPDYLLALLPALAAFAGAGVAAVAAALERLPPLRDRGSAIATVLAAPLLAGAWFALQQGLELRRPDTRVVARGWIESNLPDGARVAADTWLELPFTVECLEQMLEGRRSRTLDPARRSRDEPLEQLEARLAAARARPPRPAYDFALVVPREIDLGDELLALLGAHGFRWLVLDETRAARAERSGPALAARAAWYRRVLRGPLVVTRFDPADGATSGPPLVVLDLERR